jgi:methyl-accepting chemotaxis protein
MSISNNSGEYVLTEHDLIVSKTNLKGIITFVNEDVIRISGFSREELIGAPHNIFRHSDMPKEAFADLWRTIKSNRTWSGLVKNKTKNGGFYWVRANITPIYENDNVVGYMSARRKPDSKRVQEAEKVYTDIKAGRFKGRLNCGEAIKTDVFHVAQRKFENIKIKHKLLSLVFLSVLSILIVTNIGYFNLNALNDHHQLSLDEIEQIVIRIQTTHSAHSHSNAQGSNNNASAALLEQLEASLENDLKVYIDQAKLTANEHLSAKQNLRLITVASLLSVFIFLCWGIIRNVLNPLSETSRALVQIAKGNYLVRIDYRSGNEIGVMMEYLRSMSVNLGFEIAETNKKSNESLRFKSSLDNVDSSIVVADQAGKIIYVNKSAVKLFSNVEDVIREKIPHFKVKNLVGENINDFHLNPEHRSKLPRNLTENIQLDVLIGSKHLYIKANPIIDEFGVRLGSVTEWEDLTNEINLQNEISAIVTETTQGRFKSRIKLDDKQGFLKLLGTELNHLLAVCDTIFADLKLVLSAVALGNLTESITNNYEGEFDLLKQDTNLAVSQLNNIIEQIKSANFVINRGIDNIIKVNNDLSTRTEMQVISLENTATAIHQLAASGRKNEEDAKQANAAVNSVFVVVDKGVEIIGNVVNTMEKIHESSNKIGSIITVIDSIAFQTNILALNAAVEAARAGQQGRGFAVVATEVRSLAQRAANAAGEIKALIHDSEEKIEDGNALVIGAGKIMHEIANSISSVTVMMDRIAVSSTEQSNSIEQINSNITITETMTQQNTQSVTDVIESSNLLEEQIKALSKTIDHFKVTKEVANFQLF